MTRPFPMNISPDGSYGEGNSGRGGRERNSRLLPGARPPQLGHLCVALRTNVPRAWDCIRSYPFRNRRYAVTAPVIAAAGTMMTTSQSHTGSPEVGFKGTRTVTGTSADRTDGSGLDTRTR